MMTADGHFTPNRGYYIPRERERERESIESRSVNICSKGLSFR